MQSPAVLKAIYSLEHSQSLERMAQTLRSFEVPEAEIELLLKRAALSPSGGGFGGGWIALAERIASERSLRGLPVVCAELLRRAVVTSERRDTVRIQAQGQRIKIAPIQQSPLPKATTFFTPKPAAARPTQFVAFSSTPRTASAAIPPPLPVRNAPSLREELERASQLMAICPQLETALQSQVPVQSLRDLLQTFIHAAEELTAAASN